MMESELIRGECLSATTTKQATARSLEPPHFLHSLETNFKVDKPH
jgi:hypothetical protein